MKNKYLIRFSALILLAVFMSSCDNGCSLPATEPESVLYEGFYRITNGTGQTIDSFRIDITFDQEYVNYTYFANNQYPLCFGASDYVHEKVDTIIFGQSESSCEGNCYNDNCITGPFEFKSVDDTLKLIKIDDESFDIHLIALIQSY